MRVAYIDGSDERLNDLREWVRGVFGETGLDLAPASTDASFRRYFRLHLGESSYVVMDAPPALENCGPFVDIAERLADAGLHVPHIHEANLEQGFLLMSDLGQACYFDVLNDGVTDVGALYSDAIDAITIMQTGVEVGGLPLYDRSRLQTELDLFPEWFLQRHLGLSLTNAQHGLLGEVFEDLCNACLEQPQVFVHRDYHCRNLMAYPGGPGVQPGNPGIIDFQDAVIGPITYDLASLCRDVYVDWPATAVRAWTAQCHHALVAAGVCPPVELRVFERWLNLTAAQRLLKIAGIFARLYHRDGKARYLGDLPLTLAHLRGVCAAAGDELAGLVEFVDDLALDDALEAALPARLRSTT